MYEFIKYVHRLLDEQYLPTVEDACWRIDLETHEHILYYNGMTIGFGFQLLEKDDIFSIKVDKRLPIRKPGLVLMLNTENPLHAVTELTKVDDGLYVRVLRLEDVHMYNIVDDIKAVYTDFIAPKFNIEGEFL